MRLVDVNIRLLYYLFLAHNRIGRDDEAFNIYFALVLEEYDRTNWFDEKAPMRKGGLKQNIINRVIRNIKEVKSNEVG